MFDALDESSSLSRESSLSISEIIDSPPASTPIPTNTKSPRSSLLSRRRKSFMLSDLRDQEITLYVETSVELTIDGWKRWNFEVKLSECSSIYDLKVKCGMEIFNKLNSHTEKMGAMKAFLLGAVRLRGSSVIFSDDDDISMICQCKSLGEDFVFVSLDLWPHNNNKAAKCGKLQRRSLFGGWKTSFFELSNGQLRYGKNSKKFKNPINLSNMLAVVECYDDDDVITLEFEIELPKKHISLKALNMNDYKSWMQELKLLFSTLRGVKHAGVPSNNCHICKTETTTPNFCPQCRHSFCEQHYSSQATQCLECNKLRCTKRRFSLAPNQEASLFKELQTLWSWLRIGVAPIAPKTDLSIWKQNIERDHIDIKIHKAHQLSLPEYNDMEVSYTVIAYFEEKQYISKSCKQPEWNTLFKIFYRGYAHTLYIAVYLCDHFCGLIFLPIFALENQKEYKNICLPLVGIPGKNLNISGELEISITFSYNTRWLWAPRLELPTAMRSFKTFRKNILANRKSNDQHSNDTLATKTLKFLHIKDNSNSDKEIDNINDEDVKDEIVDDDNYVGHYEAKERFHKNIKKSKKAKSSKLSVDKIFDGLERLHDIRVASHYFEFRTFIRELLSWKSYSGSFLALITYVYLCLYIPLFLIFQIVPLIVLFFMYLNYLDYKYFGNNDDQLIHCGPGVINMKESDVSFWRHQINNISKENEDMYTSDYFRNLLGLEIKHKENVRDANIKQTVKLPPTTPSIVLKSIKIAALTNSLSMNEQTHFIKTVAERKEVAVQEKLSQYLFLTSSFMSNLEKFVSIVEWQSPRHSIVLTIAVIIIIILLLFVPYRIITALIGVYYFMRGLIARYKGMHVGEDANTVLGGLFQLITNYMDRAPLPIYCSLNEESLAPIFRKTKLKEKKKRQ